MNNERNDYIDTDELEVGNELLESGQARNGEGIIRRLVNPTTHELYRNSQMRILESKIDIPVKLMESPGSRNSRNESIYYGSGLLNIARLGPSSDELYILMIQNG